MTNACLTLIPVVAGVFACTARAQSSEANLFRQAAPSIVRVEAGLSSGSGFIVGDSTTVVTNAHVIAGADTVSIYVTPKHRVPARVVARDDSRDLAILQIPSEGCDGCRPLRLADDSVLVVGLPVAVLGYPLGQPLTITRGIVSTLRPGALLTDAAINPGNSGGPLLALSGAVVAIATFRDIDQAGVGGGLGGAILVSGLRSLLATSQAKMQLWHDSTSLPVLPVDDYAPSLLAAIADTASTMYYDRLSGIDIGPFTVRVATPLSGYVLTGELGRRVSSDRRRRENAADVAVQDRYNELASVRDWQAYVGDANMPVVSISIEPNASETLGSVLVRAVSNATVGVSGAATFKFKGDVRGLTLRRNGKVVTPLRGGHAPVRVNIDNEWISLTDVADFGLYVYGPDAFRPNADGSVPSLELEVRDLKAPDRVRKQKLEDVVVARVWDDFAAYYQTRNQPFASFTIAYKCSAEQHPVMGAPATTCQDVVGPAK